MSPKIRAPFGESTSSTVKTVIMIVSIFASLCLIVGLFYAFFQKCDHMKFAYIKKHFQNTHKHTLDDDIDGTATDIDAEESAD
ncbi:hypothetical protein [Ethanoligenens sp.]|uniref:hypothetical protein n=1 Tax=Ethanoligenens sp. TaxID=2099655 RepID=UPI0039EC81F7